MGDVDSAITQHASERLSARLSALDLGGTGFQLAEEFDDGWLHGDVTISERKGKKKFPVYSLELELPWSGHECSGLLVLPDVCLELLDDVEIEIHETDGSLSEDVFQLLESQGLAAVKAAVQQWGQALAKEVREDADSIPLDPPTEAKAPRSAALISDEEAMSASGAAALDDAEDSGEEEEEEEEEEKGEAPFTDQELDEIIDEIQVLAEKEYPAEEEREAFLKELEEEIAGKELQRQGEILLDVLEEFQARAEKRDAGPSGGDGKQGGGAGPSGGGGGGGGGKQGGGGGGAPEPYPGPAGLMELWKEIQQSVSGDDVAQIEAELKGKAPEAQWAVLLEVASYLQEESSADEAAFAEWMPTAAQIEAEWEELMAQAAERVGKRSREGVGQGHA